MMQIQHETSGTKGGFYIYEGDKRIAEMTYSMAMPDLMIIDHTEVAPVLRGKNIGAQLVQAAVDMAREKQIKILPLCPFAKAVFEKRGTELEDVLHKK